MGISFITQNRESQVVTSDATSTGNNKSAKNSSTAVGAVGSFGNFLVQAIKFGSEIGLNVLKELSKVAAKMAQGFIRSNPNTDLLKNAKAFFRAGKNSSKDSKKTSRATIRNIEGKTPKNFPLDSSVKVPKTPSSEPADPIYKGDAKTEEDDERANDTTIFRDIIKTPFRDPKKAEGAVNFLAGQLDEFIDSTIEGAVEQNPAINASKTANKIALNVIEKYPQILAPSPENIKALSPIIERRMNVLQKQQDSMVQKLLAQLTKLPLAPGLPPVPTHEIRVEPKETTTDLSSKKESVVKNVFSELQQMPKEQSDSILEKLYNKHLVPLNQKTDAKTIELIGKEYDEQQLVKEFDS